MSKVVRVLASAFSLLALLVLSSSPAYAQGGTTSTLSGIAVDSSGAVLPGADVTVTLPSTGFTQSAVTNADGAFSFPGLNIGTYTVTVKLSGFKTFISNNVVLTSGAGANVRATLEIGGLEEQVVVSSASEIIQTQSSTISSTINTNQILKLPLTTRSAMDFVTFLPGVQTPGGNRQSMINGLPQGMINITLDGVNIQDNTLRSTDGFFAIVSPRLDAIEEVTVTTAAQGSESAQGAAQIKFVTRSGTNTLTGSVYRVLSARLAEREHLVQQSGRGCQGQAEAGPVRRPPRRTDRHPWSDGWPEQGVLLLQLRTAAAAERHDANAQPAQRGRGVRHLSLYHVERRADSQPPAAGRRQRSGGNARSQSQQAIGRYPERNRRRIARGHRQQHAAVLVQRAGRIAAPLSDRPNRLQPDRQAPVQQRVELQLVHGRPRHAQQLRQQLPRIPGPGGSELGSLELEQYRPIDAHSEHGQRSAGWLQQRAGNVLQGAQHRNVRWNVGRGPGRVPMDALSQREQRRNRRHGADQRQPRAGTPVAQRHRTPRSRTR